MQSVHAARVTVRQQPLGQRVGAVLLRGDQQHAVRHVGGDLWAAGRAAGGAGGADREENTTQSVALIRERNILFSLEMKCITVSESISKQYMNASGGI